MLDLSVALFFDFLGSLEEKAYLCSEVLRLIRNDNERRKLYKIRLGDETPAAQQGQLCCA